MVLIERELIRLYHCLVVALDIIILVSDLSGASRLGIGFITIKIIGAFRVVREQPTFLNTHYEETYSNNNKYIDCNNCIGNYHLF